MDGPYTDEQIEEWKNTPPRTWEDLSAVEKVVRNDEVLLKAMLIYFKAKDTSEYSDLMIRLITNELKDPRL